MGNKVTLLEKPAGQEWEKHEMDAILKQCGSEVQTWIKMPGRLVVLNKPLKRVTFKAALGHDNFTASEVEYEDRWK